MHIILTPGEDVTISFSGRKGEITVGNTDKWILIDGKKIDAGIVVHATHQDSFGKQGIIYHKLHDNV